MFQFFDVQREDGELTSADISAHNGLEQQKTHVTGCTPGRSSSNQGVMPWIWKYGYATSMMYLRQVAGLGSSIEIYIIFKRNKDSKTSNISLQISKLILLHSNTFCCNKKEAVQNITDNKNYTWSSITNNLSYTDCNFIDCRIPKLSLKVIKFYLLADRGTTFCQSFKVPGPIFSEWKF